MTRLSICGQRELFIMLAVLSMGSALATMPDSDRPAPRSGSRARAIASQPETNPYAVEIGRLGSQNAEYGRLRSVLLRSARSSQPRELIDWAGVLSQPDQCYAEQITRAYYYGLADKPIAAFQALLSGALGRHGADSAFARQLELTELTLQPNPKSVGDPLIDDVARKLRLWRAAERSDAPRGLFAVARPLLARKALDKARSQRLPADIAARFALAMPDRPMVPLLVVALAHRSPTAENYWAASDLASSDDNRAHQAFERLSLETELQADDLRLFFDALPQTLPLGEDIVSRRFEREIDHRLARLRRLPGARTLDSGSLKFLAGVRGKSLAADLARLIDAKHFASLERSLAQSPRRLGAGR